jgi:hypothetical protein
VVLGVRPPFVSTAVLVQTACIFDSQSDSQTHGQGRIPLHMSDAEASVFLGKQKAASSGHPVGLSICGL